eukprot:2548337-Prymnesium_polylepis.1
MHGHAPVERSMERAVSDVAPCACGGPKQVKMERVAAQHVRLTHSVEFHSGNAARGGSPRDHHVASVAREKRIRARQRVACGCPHSLRVCTGDGRDVGRLGICCCTLDPDLPAEQAHLCLVGFECVVLIMYRGARSSDSPPNSPRAVTKGWSGPAPLVPPVGSTCGSSACRGSRACHQTRGCP